MSSAACNDYLKVLGLIALAYSWLKSIECLAIKK